MGPVWQDALALSLKVICVLDHNLLQPMYLSIYSITSQYKFLWYCMVILFPLVQYTKKVLYCIITYYLISNLFNSTLGKELSHIVIGSFGTNSSCSSRSLILYTKARIPPTHGICNQFLDEVFSFLIKFQTAYNMYYMRHGYVSRMCNQMYRRISKNLLKFVILKKIHQFVFQFQWLDSRVCLDISVGRNNVIGSKIPCNYWWTGLRLEIFL